MAAATPPTPKQPTPPTQLTLAARPHQNAQLFSDHYLDVSLPKNKDWQLLSADAVVQQARQRIGDIFARFTPSSNEAQTEQDLVKPVLEALGHTFEVQATLTTPDGTKRPDYIFYTDAAARDANKNKTLNEALLNNMAFAVGDAKYWERPLDMTLRTGSGNNANAVAPFSNKNPSYQIAFYMQHSGTPWGLLTNGRSWRLYHQDTAHKLDRFYEVDLPALLQSDDPEAFLYFYAFFHRQDFQAAPGYGASLGLAALLQASQDYARGVSDTLKLQVFEALRYLAQGFLDHPANGLQPDAPTLKAIYDNSLIVLYRLLFILYAEARELLPVRESDQYRDDYSLSAIKQEVQRNLSAGRTLLPTTRRTWQKLDELFEIINVGSPPLKVSTFNGGLFDAAKHPFLRQHAVGDAQLQRAIDCLARANGEFIDYRDLAERHLGTIYEGLLEYHLEALDSAPSPALPRKSEFTGEGGAAPLSRSDSHSDGRGGLGWGPPSGSFTIDLLNDKGERKASGSYYTPDYIVKYIVDKAVGPALRQATQHATTDAEKIRAILNVNVLDPAMGSGHFLVEVVEYIARYLVDALPSPVPTGEGPGVGAGDLACWKRRVAQSCVYGVDLNPLAVELAKLSLWLVTVAKDRPLSFLDHHLRAGNALVGARLADVRGFALPKRKARKKIILATAPQDSLFSEEELRQDMFSAVGSMFLIEENPALTVNDVKLQEQVYAGLHTALTQKYKRLADVMTATHFGLEVDPMLAPALAARASGKTGMVVPKLDELLAHAEGLAHERRFFHWEMEFPEVFFDRNGEPLGAQAGFDAVVGNPPYVRQELLAPFKPFLAGAFESHHNVADLYLYFYERALQLTQQGGRVAYITSGTFARANFAAAFRKWLPTVAQIESLIDFGENQPFEGAEMVRPSIVVLQRDEVAHDFRSLFIAGKIPNSLDIAMSEDGIDCSPEALKQPEWVFQSSIDLGLFSKVMNVGQPLGQFVKQKLYYGIKTGFNEAFIIDQNTYELIVKQNPQTKSVLNRMLRGEDLRPWYQEDEGRWLITLPSGWTQENFGKGLSEEDAWQKLQALHPKLSAHLVTHAELARKRGDKGDYWWELRSCNYYDAFTKPKLLWPDIGKLPRCSWDNEGKFVNNKGCIVPCDDLSLVAILQSRVNWFVTSQICTPLRLRAGLWQYQQFVQFIERLPIPPMPDSERQALAALAQAITVQAQARYALHRAVRHRLLQDLGSPDNPNAKLNQKLTEWWALPDLAALRAEVKKALKREIALKDRDEWEGWLTEKQQAHQTYTTEIIRLETELNARVYALFGLNEAEIKLIEASTKYGYGEV